jgi:pSer/pThr/pTyr-binding forkhead associated (FHA) protein
MIVPSGRVVGSSRTRRPCSTRAYIEDLGSKNGTFLRGRAITRREKVVDGDAIALGGVGLVFRTPWGDRPTRTWKGRKRPPVDARRPSRRSSFVEWPIALWRSG